MRCEYYLQAEQCRVERVTSAIYFPPLILGQGLLVALANLVIFQTSYHRTEIMADIYAYQMTCNCTGTFLLPVIGDGHWFLLGYDDCHTTNLAVDVSQEALNILSLNSK